VVVARKKNSTFTGATIYDTDVDAPTFKRVIESTVGDVALIFDKVTGQNSEASTIIHDGSADRGAKLNVPIVNQYVGHSLNLGGTIPAKGGNGGAGTFWIWCAPVFISADSTDVSVEIGGQFDSPVADLNPQVQVFSTSFVSESTSRMTAFIAQGEPDTMYRGIVNAMPHGVHYVAVSVDTSTLRDVTAIGLLNYVRIRPYVQMGSRIDQDGPINASGAAAIALRAANDFGIFTPSATEGVAHRNFDASMFADLESIDGYTLAGLNRNLNGLFEYVSGYPAGGNATYTQVDHDGSGVPDATNPARVRFEYHSQALYGSTEPQIAFPIWCECFGAFEGNDGKFAVNLAQPPTAGMLAWYAPWPIATTSMGLRSVPLLMPDFQSGTSALKAHVLIGSDASAAVGSWTFQIQTTTGNSATVAPTACDGTNTLWKCEISSIPFTGDALEQVTLVSARTGAKGGIGELCIIGIALYFDP
jgi:hypothetical protein